jgi:site-specific DNA recombinase
LVITNYNDSGYSGENLERPALQKLKEDIEFDKVDVVVVYKVDRLSRSLKDFVNLFTFFEKYQLSFTSITQKIDTSSSMGKLTLNMLLSFAQFEREITSERLKDKIKAAKKKGMWTGGFFPMGYSGKDKKLIRNKDAKIIEEIFEKIANGLTVQEVISYFSDNNILTNTKVKFCKKKIYQILNNRIYLGEISHEGKHESIISKSLWEVDHQQLKSRNSSSNIKRTAKYPALLKGLVFCKYCSCAMTPHYTKKKKVIFRYYICMNTVRYGSNACYLKRINAIELEDIIEKEILRTLRDPRISVNFLNKEKVGELRSYGKICHMIRSKLSPKILFKKLSLTIFHLKLHFVINQLFTIKESLKMLFTAMTKRCLSLNKMPSIIKLRS